MSKLLYYRYYIRHNRRTYTRGINNGMQGFIVNISLFCSCLGISGMVPLPHSLSLTIDYSAVSTSSLIHAAKRGGEGGAPHQYASVLGVSALLLMANSNICIVFFITIILKDKEIRAIYKRKAVEKYIMNKKSCMNIKHLKKTFCKLTILTPTKLYDTLFTTMSCQPQWFQTPGHSLRQELCQ